MSRTLCVAHRGGARLAPENTIAAFRAGLAAGADALELDVHLSRDGRLAVIHDALVARTTNRPGTVSEYDMDELAGFDAAARYFGAAVGVQGIPRLEEVLELLGREPYRSVELQVEIKLNGYGGRYAGIEAELVRVLDAFGFIGRATVLSFDFPTLGTIAAMRPELRRCALVGREYLARMEAAGPEAIARSVASLGVESVGVREDMLGLRLFDAFRSEGLRVGAWTVNDPGRMRQLAGMGVDFLTTDRPDLFFRLFPRQGGGG